MFIYMIQLTCVYSTLKLDHENFDILKHGTVYNILKVENDGVYISICWVDGNKTTVHDCFC